LNGILRGLTENRAQTDPTSEDPRLLGRTYAIPFEDVWQAAKKLASGELRGWSLWGADDKEGVMEASLGKRLFLQAADVRVEIGLDENAQTRVDLTSASRTDRGDLGRSRRAIGHFLKKLDRTLGARPDQILDASRASPWHDGG
jgi:hypothetical protein